MDRADFDLFLEQYAQADDEGRRSVADSMYQSQEDAVASLRSTVDELRGQHEDLSARYEALRKRYVDRFSGPKDLYDEELSQQQTTKRMTYDELFRRG